MKYEIRPLPSNVAAHRLVHGEPGAGWAVLGSMLSRAGLISLGLLMAGVEPKHVLKGALAATTVIELSVISLARQNTHA